MGSITADQYFAGVIGLSLLRNWYVDADANEARMAELSTVLARRDEFPFKFRLDPQERALPAGYAEWAEMYDGPNPLIETEELVVRPILERVAEPGVQALDAACGTGRHAAYLHDRGCTVTGVDQSLEMLAVARNKLPEVHFEQGDIEQLAFADLTLDVETGTARRAGADLELTRREAELLALLLRNARGVVTRELALEEVWGGEGEVTMNAVDRYVAYLRRKLGEPPLIHTVRGIGFRLDRE